MSNREAVISGKTLNSNFKSLYLHGNGHNYDVIRSNFVERRYFCRFAKDAKNMDFAELIKFEKTKYKFEYFKIVYLLLNH